MTMLPKFREGISCKLGNGARIQFWQDIWVGNTALATKYQITTSSSHLQFSRTRWLGCVASCKRRWRMGNTNEEDS
ncbi:hypothetical protein FRX31_029133 [Thalictrum thalictroides]|uniref:Uncharacterized protein n=1 Tax=Thalictrum thalictroides TaxID=46969 RepID=A0A7J6VA84_THATH|nr:hypothetical protein FRX31_029133 [Thalictrum thalictroides]